MDQDFWKRPYSAIRSLGAKPVVAEGDLLEFLAEFPEPRCSIDSCAGKTCPAKTSSPAWSPILFAERRSIANAREVNYAVFDLDGLKPGDLDRIRAGFPEYAHAVHTTHSHAPDSESYRIVFPLSRPMTPAEWPLVWPLIVRAFKLPADEKATDLARLFFGPTARVGVPPVFDVRPGEPVEVDEALTLARGEPDSPAPGEPVDVGALRERLSKSAWSKSRKKDSESKVQAVVIKKILDGEPIADPGGRDAGLLQATGLLCWNLPDGTPWEVALKLLLPSLSKMDLEPEGLDYWTGEALDMYERAAKKRSAARAADEEALERLAARAKAKAGDPDSDDAPEEPEELTDVGNAERLVRLAGGDLKNIFGHRATWKVWDGTHWVNNRGQVFRMAIAAARSIRAEAAAAVDDDRRARLAAHALRSEGLRSLTAMIEIARSLPEVSVEPADFDPDPELLGCENGTLDLRTGILRPSRRDDLISRSTGVSYDPDARAPTWEAFVERILPSADLRSFVQKLAGYCLSGLTSEQVLVVFHGSGANGKSTLVETLSAAMGDYSRVAEANLLLAKRWDDGPKNGLAGLAGARLVTASETESGRRLAESAVKQITGGDRITARFLYGEFFDFYPVFKVILSTNNRPEVEGSDKGILRRIRLVPFDVEIPVEQQDKDLRRKLQDELPGVLAWMVRGLAEWRTSGLGNPPEVDEAIEDYREDADSIAGFVSSCVVGEPAPTLFSEIYEAYRAWATQRGMPIRSKIALADVLKAKGFRKTRTGRDCQKAYFGIRPRRSGERR
jgi:putative DNA primase/helicase